MSETPRAPGAMGMMAASLAEHRKGGPLPKAQLERVFDDPLPEPAKAPVSVVPTPAPTPKAPSVKADKSDDIVYYLDPNDVEPWFLADRRPGEFGDLSRMTESIRINGQEVPALVRPGKTKGKYELIYGRRRWTVCKDLEIKLKTFIRAVSDQEAFEKMVLENLDREDVSNWTRALSFKAAIEAGVYPSESALAAKNNFHRATMSNIMSLTRIPEAVVEAIGEDGMQKMSIGSAKAILAACKSEAGMEKVISLASKIAEGTLSGESITKTVERSTKPDTRETKIVTTPDGKKLFSCRVTGRGMTELMFYPEALRDIPQEELLNKIKGLFCK